MGFVDRIAEFWPELVAIELFFGIALGWTPELKPIGNELLKERRYVKLTMVTAISGTLFILNMAAVMWLVS